MARKIEVAKTATFDTDDKRAQYARLIVFNFGVQEKIISKDKDVNTVSNGDLTKAVNSLAGGNLLDGKDGIELIQKLSAKGSTTGRALTTAYAQEVRPFLKRKALAPSFGRRGGGPRTKKEATPDASPKRASTKRAPAKRSSAKRSTAKRSSAKSES